MRVANNGPPSMSTSQSPQPVTITLHGKGTVQMWFNERFEMGSLFLIFLVDPVSSRVLIRGRQRQSESEVGDINDRSKKLKWCEDQPGVKEYRWPLGGGKATIGSPFTGNGGECSRQRNSRYKYPVVGVPGMLIPFTEHLSYDQHFLPLPTLNTWGLSHY